MKKKFEKIAEIVMAILFSLLIAWFLVSFLDVNIQHQVGKEPHSWNLFGTSFVIGHASAELAEYEQYKGERNIILKSMFEYTDEDLELLAHIINAEGGACEWVSDEMCFGIGSVVLNRVKSKDFPNSIYEVVSQEGQYSSYSDKNWQVPISDRSWDIAQELLDEGSCYPEEVVYQAEFTQGSGVYEKVQNMYFCYK